MTCPKQKVFFKNEYGSNNFVVICLFFHVDRNNLHELLKKTKQNNNNQTPVVLGNFRIQVCFLPKIILIIYFYKGIDNYFHGHCFHYHLDI